MENSNLYSNLARICAKFYDLIVDSKEVADFVDTKISHFRPEKVLFVGGFFSVAKELIKKGYPLTVTDYTDEMIEEGKKRLPKTKVIKADIRNLPFENEFDAVIVIGRVFTHMYSDDDLKKAFQSIGKSLKTNGILLFDNYENTKITKTNYFNGKLTVKDNSIEIIRDSSTKIISEHPFIVNWKATYTVNEDGNLKRFDDEMEHRAFSRKEIKNILEKNGFKQIENGNNFDNTSFYSLAEKQCG
jgi:ubiquinone/menaquinone biosynthesis C-methylase UbiE